MRETENKSRYLRATALMILIPIEENLEDNAPFLHEPDCKDIQSTIDYYKRIGYHFPWIGYYAKEGNVLVGAAGFKGRPKHGKIEIAYATFPAFQHRGIGTELCKQLVSIALQADPNVLITARTLPEKNFSTRILKKNGFVFTGTVMDEDDGEVWEWKYIPV